MPSVSMLLALYAALGSALMFGGLVRRRCAPSPHNRATPLAAPRRFALGHTPIAHERLDVSIALRDVLGRFSAEAARRLVRLELAVSPGLSLHADADALHDVLGDLLSHAICQAPCGRVLCCATRHGGQIEISVADDGSGALVAAQEAALRQAAQLVALQGGTLHIEALPGRGTTVKLRLPEAMDASADPAQCPVAAPNHLPQPARREVVAELS